MRESRNLVKILRGLGLNVNLLVIRNITGYNMIKSWKHKGLKLFYETGSKAKIQSKHAKKLHDILQVLDFATEPEQLDLPGLGFHVLRGDLKGYYSVSVNGNWRVIFMFDGSDVILVDYLDYH